LKRLTAAIGSLGRRRAWQEATLFLLKARRESLRADAVTHNACVSACEKGHAWEAALLLVGEMEDRGLEVDEIAEIVDQRLCEGTAVAPVVRTFKRNAR
jgi:pentatricopeptide repeat protein